MLHPVRLAALVVATAFLLTACAAEIGDPEGESTAEPQPRPSPGATPQAFLARTPLISCGEFELTQGEQHPVAALDCLEDGIGAAGAELTVTAPTSEGDPVRTWFRALPEGGMETWSDVSQDRYAGDGVSWFYSRCPFMASPRDDPGECTGESFE